MEVVALWNPGLPGDGKGPGVRRHPGPSVSRESIGRGHFLVDFASAAGLAAGAFFFSSIFFFFSLFALVSYSLQLLSFLLACLLG